MSARAAIRRRQRRQPPTCAPTLPCPPAPPSGQRLGSVSVEGDELAPDTSPSPSGYPDIYALVMSRCA